MTLEELKVVISAETKGLEKAVSGVKSKMNSLTKTVTNSTQKMTRSFDKLGKSINKSFSGLLKIAGLTAGIAGLVRLGKTAVQTASDLEEIQNVVDVVFGSGAKEIDAWAKTALKGFGLVESEAKDVASTFKAMSNGMGVNDDLGRAMSVQLTELAADLASFRNSTVETTSRALSGVFTGETEALKKFGVVMTQANLEAFAMSKGITKAYKSMSQAEQVMLRYQFVMQATADAQGDFARSANSWANQMRILRGQWTQFLGVLGTAIKQVLAPLLSALNNILATVITLTKNLLRLLGINFETTAAQVSSAGVGAEDIADGLDDATGSAKKLNKELAGFDELETIGEKLSSGVDDLADGLGDGASSLDITMPEITEDEVDDAMFKSFREAMEQLQDWFEGTMDPWLVEKSGKFADWLNKVFGDKESWAQVGTTIGAGLNGIIHALDTFWTKLDGYNIGSALGTLFNNLTTKLDWESLGHMWGEKLKTCLDIAIGFLETYDFKNLGESIARMLDNVDWKGIGERVGRLISDMLLAAMDFAIGLSTGHLGQNVSDFIDGFAEGWKGEELKQKFLEEFKPAMQEAWSELWSSLEANETIGTLVADIEELTKVLGDVLIALGAFKVLSWLVVGVTTLAETLKWAPALLGDFLTFVESGNGILGSLSAVLGETSSTWANFLVATEGARKAIGGFVAGAAPVIAIIAAIAAGLVVAYKENDNFRASVDNLWKNTIKPFIDEVKDLLKDLWENSLKPLFDDVGHLIKDLITIIKEILTIVGMVVGAIIEWLVIKFGPIFEKFIQGIHVILSGLIGGIRGVLEVVDQVVHNIIGFLEGVIDFLTGVFTGNWEKAWEGVKKIFKNVFEALVGIAKAPINMIIGFINGMIKGIVNGMNAVIRNINKVSWKVPDWVPSIGGKTFGFSVPEWTAPQIAYLAKGGVLDSPTLAMLGEYAGARNNPEIAAPESKIRDIVVNANGDMVSAFYQIATQIIQAIDNVDMSVSIGDDTIAQAAKRGSDNYYRRTGKPMYAMA